MSTWLPNECPDPRFPSRTLLRASHSFHQLVHFFPIKPTVYIFNGGQRLACTLRLVYWFTAPTHSDTLRPDWTALGLFHHKALSEHRTSLDIWDAPAQWSDHYNLTLVRVTQVFMPAHLSCIQHFDQENHLFTYCLIYLRLDMCHNFEIIYFI